MAQSLTFSPSSQQDVRRVAGRDGAGIGRTPLLSKSAMNWLRESPSGAELSRALGLGGLAHGGWR